MSGRKRASIASALMKGLLHLPSIPGRLPDRAVESLFAWRRFNAGLTRKTVRVAGFEIPYLVGGAGPPLVLLHGFGDSKDSFVDVARPLARHYRVYLPDLPGFGEASAPLDATYSLPNMAHVVGQFCDVIGAPCHLVGNSLGGAIAAYLGVHRPELLESLGLVCAAGLVMPSPSPLQLQLDAGHNPFVIDSFEEYRAWTRFVMERPPPIPEPVQRYMADRFIARGPVHAKIMDDLLNEDFDLTTDLERIETPTLVLWGSRDRLIDISVGHLYAERVAHASMVILHGVGHCPQYERPSQTARVLSDFLSRRHAAASSSIPVGSVASGR